MTQYDDFAGLYDIVYAGLEHDIPFYLELAKQSGSPVCELACGNGRVLLPIARAGLSVTGIDSSERMLEGLQARLDAEPPDVQGRVALKCADVRDYRFGTKFKLVFCAFHSFQHLETTEDQLACLRSVREYLADDGLLCLNVFAPRYDWLALAQQEQQARTITDPSTGREAVVRLLTKRNWLEQKIESTMILDRVDEQGIVHRDVRHLTLCWIFHREMHLLLRHAGFEVTQVYGGFDKRPFDYVSGEQLFLARKARTWPSLSGSAAV